AEGQAEAKRLARQHIQSLHDELDSAEVPELTRLYLKAAKPNDGVQTMPEWAIDLEEANQWRAASGEVLGDMVLQRLKIMQVLENTSAPTGWAQLMVSIGVLAWMRSAYTAYKAARLAGMARLAAVATSIKNVTVAASRMFLATVIVSVIAEIILYLMEKEAVVYMVAINLTDDALELQDIALTHGKQTVQFEDPMDRKKVLLPRTHIEGLPPEDDAYWMGLFVAQKRDMALYGSQGAFILKPSGKVFPNNLYVGWEIPLTNTIITGGPNRCLVSATYRGSASNFSDETDRRNVLESEDRAGRGLIRGRMHSGKGSRGYMSVIFDTV
ncbi:MAG TPA: hypothetical protein VK899_10355, partial [Gemmatimonadales bacterium]|nr:hypothetical protein [Gemmatimonadales bacterium]